jgi:4-hydroxybenzoate polyprenyltransferase
VSRALLREARIIGAVFSLDNLSVTVVPGGLFTLSAWVVSGGSVSAVAGILAASLWYFFLYGYSFCLSNQLAGLAEDRLNKPHRPLVTGLMSIPGARARLVLAMTTFVGTGWVLGVLEWSLLWCVTTLLHNQVGLSRFWIAKNVAISVGMVAMLAAGWQMVSAMSAPVWRWVLVIAAVNQMVVAVQDLRDVEGDAAVGRRTFVMVFGEWPSRIFLASGFLVLPICLHTLLVLSPRHALTAHVLEAVAAGINVLIAARILVCRTKRGDHRTYLIYCWWYCLTLLLAGAVL